MALRLPTVEALRAQILDLCLASKVYELPDQERCLALAHVLQQWQVGTADVFVAQHGQVPILHIYSSDSTPLKTTTHTTSVSAARGTRVTRKGLKATDFLLQRRYLKSISPAGANYVHAVVGVPLPMLDGKSADHHLGCCPGVLPFDSTGPCHLHCRLAVCL